MINSFFTNFLPIYYNILSKFNYQYTKMKLGSEEHKQLFCHSFIDSYLDYEPEKLPWPELDELSLNRLKGIPFWREALITEREAGIMVSAFAETIDDPILKKAIALQGKEEYRHARLVEYLIKHYEIDIKEPPPVEVPDKIQGAFINFGFGECLDSFFAFGMFGIARQAKYLPEEFFHIFDPILDEEARHIVFFINWVTYLQIQQGRGWFPLRSINTLISYGKAIQTLITAFGSVGEDKEGKPFTASEASHFTDNLTPELFLSTCLAENAQRMRVFDQHLLQPRLMPRISSIALYLLKLFPQKTATPALLAKS
jgi:hypothetical protein